VIVRISPADDTAIDRGQARGHKNTGDGRTAVRRGEQDLRKIVGPANKWFTSKILTGLDRRCREFIAASPFVVVGSTDLLGMVDLSPKGDRAGFVRCLDASTLAIPDRRGNRRVDTFHNVLRNPGVGLIFFVPGRRETLRVTGRAMIMRDNDIRSAMTEGGRIPELALIVAVERVFFHCGKCISRSKLWDHEAHRGQASEWSDDAPAL
jgi:PPOX class probable FMN-dependent enzyme